MNEMRGQELSTPAGTLAVVADADGVVVAAGFDGLAACLERLAADGDAPALAGELPRVVTDAVRAYADGDTTALSSVTVRQPGADFTQGVWQAMRYIPAGQALTYGELAALVGRPAAARAVGQACATNRVAPFVPCHRVVPAGGGVGSYAYGSDVKSALLRHEGWQE